MTQVSIDEIRRDFSAYLQRVEAGETLIIVEAGKPVAEIKPIVSDSDSLRVRTKISVQVARVSR